MMFADILLAKDPAQDRRGLYNDARIGNGNDYSILSITDSMPNPPQYGRQGFSPARGDGQRIKAGDAFRFFTAHRLDAGSQVVQFCPGDFRDNSSKYASNRGINSESDA